MIRCGHLFVFLIIKTITLLQSELTLAYSDKDIGEMNMNLATVFYLRKVFGKYLGTFL